jgi:hypothetical protein
VLEMWIRLTREETLPLNENAFSLA